MPEVKVEDGALDKLEDKEQISAGFRKRSAATIVLAASVIVALILVWYASDLLLLTFTSILFATFLRSLSDPLAHHLHLPERVSLGLVLIVLALSIWLAGWIFSAEMAKQFGELSSRLPKAVDQLEATIGQYELGRYLLEQSQRLDQWLIRKPNLFARATGLLSATFGILSSILIIFFMGLFIAFNPGLYVRGMVQLIPPHKRARAHEVLSTVGHVMRWWILGKSISMLIIGLATGIGLKLLGINLALVLGVLAGILAFIPYFGPVLSATPAVLLALVNGPQQASYVLILYLVIQGVESNLLTPIIERKTVYLPPALTIFAQVLAAILFGFLGVLLASPLTAVAMILVQKLYIEDILENGSRHPNITLQRRQAH